MLESKNSEEVRKYRKAVVKEAQHECHLEVKNNIIRKEVSVTEFEISSRGEQKMNLQSSDKEDLYVFGKESYLILYIMETQ